MARATRYHALSWLARTHDPFRTVDGVAGPTLTLLTDRRSEVYGRVDRLTLLHQSDERSQTGARAVQVELGQRQSHIQVELLECALDSPTDHECIRRAVTPSFERVLQDGSLTPLVHLSPGTPAMHAVWLLLCTTEPQFAARHGLLVETGRAPEAAATREVRLDLASAYQLYQRYVSAGTSAERPGISNPAALRSPALREVYEAAARVARLRMPVLILGERGTGKSTLAAWIRSHTPARSRPRADAVWQVACGEFSEALLASELFGHVKGAFTGATGDRDGLLCQQDGDSLFLDEIADLGRPLQRQLIKVIEDGAFRPVGANQRVEADVRLLFATNVPEPDLGNRLDPDFLDRIGYVRLRMPPLRECQPDHEMLWRDVVRRASARAGFDLASQLSNAHERRVLDWFAAHSLPGNLRDFYTVAYLLCADLVQHPSPEATGRAIDHATQALEARYQSESTSSAFRDVAKAYRSGSPLDAVYRHHGPVDIVRGTHEFQAWIARESKRASKRMQSTPQDLTGVPLRTLDSWIRRAKQKPTT